MKQSSLVEDKGVKRSVELFKDYHCKKCGSVDVDVFVSDNSLCLKCDDCNERVIFRTDDKKQGALEELKKQRVFLDYIIELDLEDDTFDVSPEICDLIERELKMVVKRIEELEKEVKK